MTVNDGSTTVTTKPPPADAHEPVYAEVIAALGDAPTTAAEFVVSEPPQFADELPVQTNTNSVGGEV
jgi:hypothetical protein